MKAPDTQKPTQNYSSTRKQFHNTQRLRENLSLCNLMVLECKEGIISVRKEMGVIPKVINPKQVRIKEMVA